MSRKRKRALVGPADLVAELVSRRARLPVDCLVAPEEQPAAADVWELCQGYCDDEFEEMDDDFNRNAAYVRAFEAVPTNQTRWLEIGCGAAATLTKLASATEYHAHTPGRMSNCGSSIPISASGLASAKAPLGTPETASLPDIAWPRILSAEVITPDWPR